MTDRQFRLPRRDTTSHDDPTQSLSRADLERLQALDDATTGRTAAITAEELGRLRRRGRREQLRRLPSAPDPAASPTEAMSREQVGMLERKGRADQVGKLPRTRVEARKSKRSRSLLRELALVIGIALTLSMLVKTFLVQPFWIPSGSMEQTLVPGDRVVVSKLSPGVFDLERGDVVVFADDGKWLVGPTVERSTLAQIIVKPLQFVGFYPEGDNHLVKRIIGLPGDRVSCTPERGMSVNGVKLHEPYLYPGDTACQAAFDIVVPPERVWVMGDHRSGSSDSRDHDEDSGGRLGSIPISSITGRAVAIVWPLARMGGLSNHSTTFDKVPDQ